MRPLIQYDLDEPPAVHSAPVPTNGPHPDAPQPPSKKRKRNHRNPQNSLSAPPQKALVQHWDDPGSTSFGVAYDDEGNASIAAGSTSVSFADGVEEAADEYGAEAAEGDEGANVDADEEEEESRPLMHEEIWDDSALIDAWNSAEAEYEAYHGTSKAWKTEPLKKSPLWYNKPYTPPAPQPSTSKPKSRSKHVPPLPEAQGEDGDPEPDSVPLDFDTFVPTHDPSLGMPSITDAGAGTATAPFFVPPASMATVSRDEAFNNALSAMYWTGYWTAVYHCRSQTSDQKDNGPAEAAEEDGFEAGEDADKQDLVPAQR